LAGVVAHEVAHLENRDFQAVFLRQLLLIGLLDLLSDDKQSGLRLGVEILHILNELRSSRVREGHADLEAVELALQAGYDPGGLVEFMAHGASARSPSTLERLLLTHPPPAERYELAAAASHEALVTHYDLTMRLAARMQDLGRSNRALELYRLASEARPSSPQPALARAAILEGQRRWAEAAGEFRIAAAASHSPELYAIADALRKHPQPPTPNSAPDAQVAAAMDEVIEKLSRVRDANAHARARLIDDVRRLARERRVRQALTYSQVINGEWSNPRFVATLLAAQRLLHRCLQWPDRALALCTREADTRVAFRRLATQARSPAPGADLDQARLVARSLAASAAPAQTRASEAIAGLAAQSGHVREAAIQVSVVLLLLLEANYDRPTNWTRFSVAASQLAGAQGRMQAAEAVIRRADDDVTSAAIEAIRAQMDWEGAQVPLYPSHPYCRLMASTFSMRPDGFAEMWAGERMLGSAAIAACNAMLAHEPPETHTAAQLVLMRLAGNSLRAEKAPPMREYTGPAPTQP